MSWNDKYGNILLLLWLAAGIPCGWEPSMRVQRRYTPALLQDMPEESLEWGASKFWSSAVCIIKPFRQTKNLVKIKKGSSGIKWKQLDGMARGEVQWNELKLAVMILIEIMRSHFLSWKGMGVGKLGLTGSCGSSFRSEDPDVNSSQLFFI